MVAVKAQDPREAEVAAAQDRWEQDREAVAQVQSVAVAVAEHWAEDYSLRAD